VAKARGTPVLASHWTQYHLINFTPPPPGGSLHSSSHFIYSYVTAMTRRARSIIHIKCCTSSFDICFIQSLCPGTETRVPILKASLWFSFRLSGCRLIPRCLTMLFIYNVIHHIGTISINVDCVYFYRPNCPTVYETLTVRKRNFL